MSVNFKRTFWCLRFFQKTNETIRLNSQYFWKGTNTNPIKIFMGLALVHFHKYWLLMESFPSDGKKIWNKLVDLDLRIGDDQDNKSLNNNGKGDSGLEIYVDYFARYHEDLWEVARLFFCINLIYMIEWENSSFRNFYLEAQNNSHTFLSLRHL